MGFIGSLAEYERWLDSEARAHRFMSEGRFGDTFKRAEDIPAMQRAFDAIEARARHTTFREVKFLARRFADFPSTLNSLYPGLSGMSDAGLIRYARSALGIEGRQRISGADMVMNTRAMNLYAAMVFGRYRRRAAINERLKAEVEAHRAELADG